jgi:WD40 repeat protein
MKKQKIKNDKEMFLPHINLFHENLIKTNSRICTALGLDPYGTRFACGSVDSTVDLHEFAGTTGEIRSFRRFMPHDGNIIKAISWSPSGSHMLIADSSSQAKIYNRDGRELGECPRGDMYIKDLKMTEGHTAGLVTGQWNPLDINSFLTGSEDGTIRIWDAIKVVQKSVIKPQTTKRVRFALTTCCFYTDGQGIAASLDDGSILIWDTRDKLGNSVAACTVPAPPQQMIAPRTWSYLYNLGRWTKCIHKSNNFSTGIVISYDGTIIASRGINDSVDFWDLRNPTQVLKTFSGLTNEYSNTQVIISPGEDFFVTGTSISNSDREKSSSGQLIFIHRKRLEIAQRVGMDCSIIQMSWHPTSNHLLVSGGHKMDGCIKVFKEYRKRESVITCNITSNDKCFELSTEPQNIVAPFTLIEDYQRTSRTTKCDAKTMTNSYKPDISKGLASKPSCGGCIGTSQKTLLTQHLLKKTQGKNTGFTIDQDPREAFIKYSKKGRINPIFTNAYSITQPILPKKNSS